MRTFNREETDLIFRALMVLSYILPKAQSKKCFELAQHFVSDFRASQMLAEESEGERE